MKTLKQYISLDENLLSLDNYILEAEENDKQEDTKQEDEMDLDALNSDQPDGKTNNDTSDDNGEDEDEDEKKKLTRRGNIKFTIWEEPKKKVNWLDDNNKYQKIEYQYRDKEKNIDIDFLLGFQNNSWKLWIGKIGAITYDDDPWCDFKTNKFSEGIVAALDKVEEFIDDVEENPDNWVQFYKS